MNIKNKILNTYNQLYTIKDDLYNLINCSEFIIDEFLMFVSIYSHYNFKDNGCPYYDINYVLTQVNHNEVVRFKPKYTIFLQDSYDLLFNWIFNYKVKSTRISIVKLNIKININQIQFEIYNYKTIKELFDIIAEYFNLKTTNLKIKKNNLELEDRKHIVEYKLDNTSMLTLYFNQSS